MSGKKRTCSSIPTKNAILAMNLDNLMSRCIARIVFFVGKEGVDGKRKKKRKTRPWEE
jgi:hypothetical protein